MVPALVPCVYVKKKKKCFVAFLHLIFNQSVNRVEFQKTEKAFRGPLTPVV